MKNIMSSKRYESKSNNIYHMLSDRMLYTDFGSHVRRRSHAAPQFLRRLELEADLESECSFVNCLEWSSNGRILASGSSSVLKLWDPFRKKRLQTIYTSHSGNMSFKFLPKFNDSLIAIAAENIELFDVNNATESLYTCVCHRSRINRLATAPDSPYVFWSAGQDGVVLQLDHREKHVCRSAENRVRLINLASHIGVEAEAKYIAVNPMRTEFIAVGANDPYARIYDRRMLKTGSSAGNGVIVNGKPEPCNVIPKDCVAYYCPGHISMNHIATLRHQLSDVPYLTFNSTGTELLVNMAGEHLYIYDLHCAEQPVLLNLPDFKLNAQESVDPTGPMESASHHNESQSRRKLPDQIEELKKRGNEFRAKKKYYLAIRTYSDAISAAPKWPVLYLNRAIAYMRRQWFGDVYAALKDCHTALSLDPTYVKAHFRLARSLLELDRPHEADECLKELIRRFPCYATNHGVLMLNKDITDASSRYSTRQQEEQAEVDDLLYCGKMSDDEFYWRYKAKDYKERFVGHCNYGIEIQEANYFGNDGDFIVAGSYDGNFFIWERKSGNIHSIYKADCVIVKCVVPHPEICLLATSGYDRGIKIWSPLKDDEKPNSMYQLARVVKKNQMKLFKRIVDDDDDEIY